MISFRGETRYIGKENRMSLREEQCKKVCRILDDVLANRPTERDSLIIAVRKAFESLEQLGNSEPLPSAQPERKTGKWVGIKEYCDHLNEEAEREGKGTRYMPSGMNIHVYCNQCWESNDRRTTYCPNCGSYNGGD